MSLPWQQSDLHPHALTLDDAALDRPDLADALRTDIAAFNLPDVIHRYRVVARAGQAETDLIAAGFMATRVTHITELPLEIQHHPTLARALPARVAPHWFNCGERAPWDDWVAAHWRHYRATHRSNPPNIPETGLNDIFIGDDLICGLALRDGPQGRTRAFGSLRKSDEGGQNIGWIGGAPDLLPQTLHACLRRATAIGWTSATIEVDDDDHALWSLMQTLDIAPLETYVTWHKDRRENRSAH